MILSRRDTVAGALAASMAPDVVVAAPDLRAQAVETAALKSQALGFSGQVHLEIDSRVALSRAYAGSVRGTPRP
jgi:hypothetical protein